MSRRLRAAAVSGCTALLFTTVGLAVSPALADDAPPAPASFSLAPAYGEVGATVTLTAQGATSFPVDGTATVKFNDDVAATTVTPVSPSELSVVVPSGASTGPVSVDAAATTYDGPTFTLQQPTVLTATLSPTLLTFGDTAVVDAKLSTAGAVTLPIAGVVATLERRTNGSSVWEKAAGSADQTTNGNGRASWTVRPASNRDYRVHFVETPEYADSSSGPLSMRVRPQVAVKPVTTAPVGSITRITGSLRPRLSGHVMLEKRRDGSWRRADRAKVHHGKFHFGIDPGSYNLLHYRVVRPADKIHHVAFSRVLDIQAVHNLLVYGNSGADVSALQKRLRTLHYDVGPESSFYGWDMVHAVTAFQKVQGFSRTGRADLGVWQRLAYPKRPHLKYHHVKGTSVEVNLAKQILMIGKNGHVWRILDTSTGGGYSYTGSDGNPAVAITPTGRFSVRYKETGWRKSKLGELFYPSYFTTTGFAIHGEGDTNAGANVPSYPASHGCVRITNRAVLRYYFKVFTVGVPVSIYR